jgi:hypothetical protein
MGTVETRTTHGARNMNNDRTFAVYHKGNAGYFSHFDGEGAPVWSNENDAHRMTKLEAEAQAACFIAHRHDVQRKAVRL